jgi:glycosyltransferase involved in cell wall biosynthesis
MVHACSDCCDANLPIDRDRIIYVSETAKKSWGIDGEVINNMLLMDESKEPLFLISASRFDTPEKGQARVLKLANLMNNKGIPFIWLFFSNVNLNGCPPNLIRMPPTLDVRGYIRKADYLVQLSDTESFCYSLIEALTEGVPVITTPLPVLKEIGVNEENSYVVPFDIPDDYDVEKFFTNRKKGTFNYWYNNDKLHDKWVEVLENPKPIEFLNVEVTANYHDVKLGREVKAGEKLQMEKKRALYVQSAGYCKIVKE